MKAGIGRPDTINSDFWGEKVGTPPSPVREVPRFDVEPRTAPEPAYTMTASPGRFDVSKRGSQWPLSSRGLSSQGTMVAPSKSPPTLSLFPKVQDTGAQGHGYKRSDSSIRFKPEEINNRPSLMRDWKTGAVP